MKVLVVGNGGREHALVWKLKQSPQVTQIYCAPGNPGTGLMAKNVPAEGVSEIVRWLEKNIMDLVVIGPDRYLAEGLTDAIEAMQIQVFGPTKRAAEIEWSKAYAKEVMRDAGIPTAAYQVFSDINEAHEYIRTQRFPIVIKADGLASGKGVIIAQSLVESERALNEIFEDNKFGAAGERVVVEEYLQGLEISVHAFCDGERAIMFPASKDHKRIFENDRGPNTGGMGTVAPVPGVDSAQIDKIKTDIVLPLLSALKKRGRIFRGVLFPGIMLTKEGPKVIEFNARFGDPEAQSYMQLLDSDLFDILYACASGTLERINVRWREGFACCVVLAAKGYPEAPESGATIMLGESYPDKTVIFHAGTRMVGSDLIVSGGRVLGIGATGSTLKGALDNVYRGIEAVDFMGKQYRKDIGASVL